MALDLELLKLSMHNGECSALANLSTIEYEESS